MKFWVLNVLIAAGITVLRSPQWTELGNNVCVLVPVHSYISAYVYIYTHTYIYKLHVTPY